MVAGSAAGMGGGDAEWSGAGFEQGLEHGPLFGRELDDSFAGDGAGELAEFDAGGSAGGGGCRRRRGSSSRGSRELLDCWGGQCDLDAKAAFGAGLELKAAIVSGDRGDDREA